MRDSIYSAHDGTAATCNVETEQINGSMSHNNGPHHRLSEEGEEEQSMDPHVAPEVTLTLQLTLPAKGDCLISVTWLPTAQRVSFSVMRVQGLQKHHSGPLNPYVRVIQLSSLGRSLKRKKTPPATRSTDSADTASFPETLSFDVPPLQAESATFLVTLWHRVTPVHHNSSSDDTSSECDVTPDVCLGKIALGRGVRGTAERLHWLSVLQNPRKVITHWHTLH
ncbi:hypothetical protein B566_EDAN016047 [Ephemera danica]|nr:hypothetical protein B566_EDAN016047 [Ephemera danica]